MNELNKRRWEDTKDIFNLLIKIGLLYLMLYYGALLFFGDSVIDGIKLIVFLIILFEILEHGRLNKK